MFPNIHLFATSLTLHIEDPSKFVLHYGSFPRRGVFPSAMNSSRSMLPDTKIAAAIHVYPASWEVCTISVLWTKKIADTLGNKN